MNICKNKNKMKDSKIKKIKARGILDSRGNPTIEVELETDFGIFRASVPAGASKGKHEAVELRNKKAIKNVNEVITPKLIGKDPTNQKEIDNLMIELDGTENKSKLGANAICGVSMVICRAGAKAKNIPLYQHIAEIAIGVSYGKLRKLPSPCFNVINGGVHAGNELDFQEFMVVPQAPTPKFGEEFSKNLRIGKEIYRKLEEILFKRYGKKGIQLGDEGGFAPPIKFPEEAIVLILEATKKLNYEIKIILDVAASQFLKNGKYQMKIGVFIREGLLRYYEKLIKNYPILGIEDPFSEDAWEGWQIFSSKFKVQSSKFLIIGDDLTVTNQKRIKEACKKKACNAMIVKINQVGTVSEAITATKLARSFNWKVIVSHRSGETTDSFISDFAVGVGAEFIKAGAPAKKERTAKYNRLLEIEKELHA